MVVGYARLCGHGWLLVFHLLKEEIDLGIDLIEIILVRVVDVRLLDQSVKLLKHFL
tara:strand:+ start:1099 stop:1266 length:168 start_codon:yes stop_codon:yes gene_type:complete